MSQKSEVHFLLPGSITSLGGYTFSACGNKLTTFVIGSDSNPLDFSKLSTVNQGNDFKSSGSGYKSIIVTISDSSLEEAARLFFI